MKRLFLAAALLFPQPTFGQMYLGLARGGACNGCVSSAGYQTMSAPTGYSSSALVFEDTFGASTLNSSNWNPWMGNRAFGRWGDGGNLANPYSAVGNGGGNNLDYGDPYSAGYGVQTSGTHMLTGSQQTGTNITPNNGIQLTCTKSTYFAALSYQVACAYINSLNKFTLPSGGFYVQVRAKMPDMTTGEWPSIWLLDDTTGGNELDLFEGGYYKSGVPYNQVMASNVHTSGNSQKIVDTGVDLTAGYHIYGLKYIPGVSVTTYLDGVQIANFTSNIPSLAYDLIISNTFASSATSGWHSPPNLASYPGPFNMYVNDVQVYHN